MRRIAAFVLWLGVRDVVDGSRPQRESCPAKITIKSEIQRGGDAAFHCLIKTHFVWLDFSSCLDEVLSAETQRNTISDPFSLGFYYKAYVLMGTIGKATPEVRESGLFVKQEQFYFKTQGQLRKSLHLSENDICHALEIPTCTALAPP